MMMFQRQTLTIAILAASLGLAACNSNDHDSLSTSTSIYVSTTTITVTPSLGKILSGRVVLRDAKTGVDLAPAKTLTPTDNGTATFTVPIVKLAEPVVAAVLPNLHGKVDYADEAIPNQVTTITVANADINKPIIRAAASLTPNANLGVTALTEAAVQQAEKAAGGLIAQNINQANAAVKNQLKLNFDITQAPIVVGLNEFDKLINAALDQQRRTYAVYLATLAKESKRLNPTNTQPAFDMAKAFAADFSDGTFDGKEGLAALTIYNSQFITAWSNWVQSFYSQFVQFNTLAALNTWVGNFNAEQPTTSNTCANKNLPTAQLSSITDFVGSYLVDNNGVKSTLTLTANGDVSLKNQSSLFKEVCGPNVQNNGTNIVLITQQGNITLFKDNNNVITAEGEDFTTAASDNFYGAKQTQTNNTQILHPAMVRTYFGQIWQTTGTGIPARTPCTISLNQAGELSVSVASVRYAVTIPNQILDFDADLTQDGNRIKAAGSYSATWAGRAHTTNYGIGWIHYTSSNLADGPVSTSVTSYVNGSYASTPQIVCDTYSTTGGASPLGDGAAGAIEIGTDGSFKAATVTAKTMTNARVQTWTDPAYGEVSVTYGSANKVISNITVKRTVGGTKSFECSGAACAGAGFSGVNKVPSLILKNLALTGTSNQTLNGMLLESLDANNPPVVVNSDTCASLGINTGQLSSIALFVGSYDVTVNNGSIPFSLEATGKVTLNGQSAQFKELCGPYVESNGEGRVLITDKANVKFLVDHNGTRTVEGKNFTNPIADQNYFGYVPFKNTCTSEGADNKLGFADAPIIFCGFNSLSSSAISAPDIYTFVNGSDIVKITVVNNSVSSVSAENSRLAFACGLDPLIACTGVTFHNGATTKEFTFKNTSLAPVSGQGQALTVKNGSLIHPLITTVVVNKAACPSTSGTFVTNCTADVLPDFGRVMLKTVAGEPCNIGKVGGVLSASSGVNTISALFNGEVSDSVGVRNATTSAVTAETRSGFTDYTGVEVTVENGQIVGAFAVSKTPDISFQCVL